jgi:uncharacterized protein (TIGR02996 family)
MHEREGLMAAIRAAPEDDTPRLILADWLDEHDDPLGEFIRLQIALEPLRRPCADPAAELERHKRLHKIPPEWHLPDRQFWPVGQQLDREEKLLQVYRAVWLGEVANLEVDHPSYFEPEFRRGFVSSATIGLTALAEHGPAVRRACPALQRLIIYGTLGRGKELASCKALDGLPELLLAGWLSDTDVEDLSSSPYLERLRSLTFWIGGMHDETVYRILAHLPGLEELTLVQMWGGAGSDDPEGLDRDAALLASLVYQERPELQVRLERPFARRFPLDGVHIGYGIDAGHLPDGQAVLVAEGKQPILMYFDAEGRFLREEQFDFSDRLVKPPRYRSDDCDAGKLMEVLKQEMGFVPGPIFVREFWAEQAGVGVSCWGMYQEELAAPGSTLDEDSEEIAKSLYWWWSTSQFLLPFGNYYWADGLGRVHSS